VFNEAVAVEVVCCFEGEERAHAHDEGTEHFVANVEVVMGEAAALVGDNAVIGIFGGIFRDGDTERRSDLQALYTP